MPKKGKRGSGWTRPRSCITKVAPAPVAAAAETEKLLLLSEKTADGYVGEWAQEEPAAKPLLQWAPWLWRSDYRALTMGDRAAAADMLNVLPKSSYRARLKGDKAAAYDEKATGRVQGAMEHAAAKSNQRKDPPEGSPLTELSAVAPRRECFLAGDA